jgi:AraC family transcriptional regulator
MRRRTEFAARQQPYDNRFAGWASVRVHADAPDSYEVTPDGVRVFKVSNVAIQFFATDLYKQEEHKFVSVRCAFAGERVYEVNGGRIAVDDTSYLLLNPGQSVISTVQSPTRVECFGVYIWPSVVQRVLRSQITSADRLLDDPDRAGEPSLVFFEQRYRHDDVLSPLLYRIRESFGKEWATCGWMEEQFYLLVERMLAVHRNVRVEVESLPSVRASTRVELHQRLHRGRDFIEASLHQPINLATIAEVAWISPHHFLRSFKQAFGETPHQYLTRRRLERAKRLLTTTDQPVTEICYALGFESLGSFSWLFRRHFGLSPNRFRRESGGLTPGS